MSAPPAYSTPSTINPDRRPLPDGYITRYDENYRAWYYVWTRSDPPRSSWSHPLDSQPQSFLPQGNFAPPPNPPPPDRIGYSSGGVGGGNRPYNPPQPAPAPYTGQQQFQPSSFPAGGGGGFSSNTNTQDARYAQTPGYQALPNYGAPSPTYGHQWPNWQQPQPQQAYVPQTQPQAVQQPGRGGRAHGLIGGGGSGSGLGVGLAAGTAGLVGGALLDEGYEHHENQEAYDQSFNNGFDDGQF